MFALEQVSVISDFKGAKFPWWLTREENLPAMQKTQV